jgi:N-acetyl-anhydromuramyl-L-alanine amidase AmpD
MRRTAGAGSARSTEGKTYHIGYHYVIFPDGRVERGRPERVRGAHAAGHNSWLGICLIGNFEQHAEADDEAAVRPTAAQMVALTKLTRALMAKYQIDAARVLPHGALDARTACPGHRFPWKSFFAELAAPAS